MAAWTQALATGALETARMPAFVGRARYCAVVVHLDHDRGYVRPEMLANNRRIRAETQARRATRTAFGLVREDPPGGA
jgi:hypothetical protein